MNSERTVMQEPIDQFLDHLASSAPTPGGGSAAAVMGAMGAALTSMVCNVTIGKKGLEGVEAPMLAVRAESARLQVRLTEMMAEDIAAFDGLMAAYKLPKATEEDKARRSAAIESSLRRATEVPLACARACAAVIALTQRAADLGYKGVVSDAGVAVLAAFAALRSAALNVYINAPMLRDRIFADQSMAEIDRLVASAAADSEAVYTTVRGRL
jgi:formiminotetrahydrofolate cyclodeaminase